MPPFSKTVSDVLYSRSQTRAISRMYFLLGSPNAFRDRRHEVARVHDGNAESGQALAESGDAERGRPHVHAAPVAAKIQGNADDVYGPGHPPRIPVFDASLKTLILWGLRWRARPYGAV
jgi:hypothetical protein